MLSSQAKEAHATGETDPAERLSTGEVVNLSLECWLTFSPYLLLEFHLNSSFLVLLSCTISCLFIQHSSGEITTFPIPLYLSKCQLHLQVRNLGVILSSLHIHINPPGNPLLPSWAVGRASTWPPWLSTCSTTTHYQPRSFSDSFNVK